MNYLLDLVSFLSVSQSAEEQFVISSYIYMKCFSLAYTYTKKYTTSCLTFEGEGVHVKKSVSLKIGQFNIITLKSVGKFCVPAHAKHREDEAYTPLYPYEQNVDHSNRLQSKNTNSDLT